MMYKQDETLRPTIVRNMAYSEQNAQYEDEIKRLRPFAANNPVVQQCINGMQQQINHNLEQMRQPYQKPQYSAPNNKSEYYIQEAPHPQQQLKNYQPRENDIWQKGSDFIGHMSQGVSLGWGDEILGGINGVGTVMANGVRRAFGLPVNNESFADAYNRGYREYVDFARYELKEGMRRNPTISIAGEVSGSMLAPRFSKYLPLTPVQNVIGTGVVNGMGYANENTVEDYGKNIAMSVGMNALGSLGGSYLFPKQNISGEFGRAAMNIGSQALPNIQNYMENRYGY